MNARRVPRPRLALALALPCALLAACLTPPLETPPEDTNVVVPGKFPQSLRNKVDLLFVIDNSSSMEAMSTELSKRFPELFQVFSDVAADKSYADLHIGVVTSDYGAGDVGASGCDPSPGGQRGRLQAIGQYAAPTCKPPRDANFLAYAFAPTGSGANNLPSGQDLLQTFTCMASVGAHGCGFEHPLEAAYAALHNNLPENAGFVRDDAILVVVFLTNEDDGSAPPDTEIYNTHNPAMGPATTFRQTQWGVECGDPPTMWPQWPTDVALADCRPAPNLGGAGPGREYDVSRYVDFFTRPRSQGGIKVDPADVLLVGIDAPAAPFVVDVATDATAAVSLRHSCVNATDPRFFGDPSVRLNTVISSVKNFALSSICESDFSPAMRKIGEAIRIVLGHNCIEGRFPRDDQGGLVVDCAVQSETELDDGSQAITQIARCKGGDTTPCWNVAPDSLCSEKSPDGVALTVDHHGAEIPPHTFARFACATVP